MADGDLCGVQNMLSFQPRLSTAFPSSATKRMTRPPFFLLKLWVIHIAYRLLIYRSFSIPTRLFVMPCVPLQRCFFFAG